VLQVSGILGNIATAAIIQRWPRDQRVLVTGLTLVNAVAIGGELVLPGAGLLWSALLGVGGGGLIVLALSLFGLRTRDHHQAAALSGMAQSVGYLIAAVGPVLIGAVHDATAAWGPALAVMLAILAGQLVAGLGATRHRHLDGPAPTTGPDRESAGADPAASDG
jgi:CP family cyanate transporter-like MFS transporter